MPWRAKSHAAIYIYMYVYIHTHTHDLVQSLHLGNTTRPLCWILVALTLRLLGMPRFLPFGWSKGESATLQVVNSYCHMNAVVENSHLPCWENSSHQLSTFAPVTGDYTQVFRHMSAPVRTSLRKIFADHGKAGGGPSCRSCQGMDLGIQSTHHPQSQYAVHMPVSSVRYHFQSKTDNRIKRQQTLQTFKPR